MTVVAESPIAKVLEAAASTESTPKLEVRCRRTFRVTSPFDRASFYRVFRDYLGPDFVRLAGGCLSLSNYTKSLWRALQRRSVVAELSEEITMELSPEDGFSQLSACAGVEDPDICSQFLHTKPCAGPKELVVIKLQGSTLVYEQGVIAA